MSENYNKDEATERSPQYRYMINQENKERRKANRSQSSQGGGRRVGKKLPDGTFAQVSTPDCDWHVRWQNPDYDEIVEHAKKRNR